MEQINQTIFMIWIYSGLPLVIGDLTLDIQSYLLRFGVWMVCFWGPNTFSAGVWMSRVTYFSFQAKRCNLLKAQAAETPMHANDRVDVKKAPVVSWRFRFPH